MKKEKKRIDKNRLFDEIRGNLLATFAAVIVIVGVLLAFCLFRAGELGGSLLCETETGSGRQTFVYDLASRKKTLLWVDGYTDIRMVTGYTGESFYCCGMSGDTPCILKVRQGKAERAYGAQAAPSAMTEDNGMLYLMLGEGGNGALMRLEPDTGEQAVLQTGLYAPGGFCVSEEGLVVGRFSGELVNWVLITQSGEKLLLQSQPSVKALALFGRRIYFEDTEARRLFYVSADTGERGETAILPALAGARAEEAPLFAFSYTPERRFLCLTNAQTPLRFRVFVIDGRFTTPVVPFGLIEKGTKLLSVKWI